MSVAQFKPLWSGWMSGAARPAGSRLWGFKMLSLVHSPTGCRRNNNQRCGRGIEYLSSSSTVTIKGGPSDAGWGDHHEKNKIQDSKLQLNQPAHGLTMACKRNNEGHSAALCLFKTTVFLKNLINKLSNINYFFISQSNVVRGGTKKNSSHA